MANEKSFEVGGLQFTAIRKQIPVLHWVIRIDENGEVLEAGAGGISTESVPKMQASVHELFERVSKNDVADFRRRFGLPAQPLTKVSMPSPLTNGILRRERGSGVYHDIFKGEVFIIGSQTEEEAAQRLKDLEANNWTHLDCYKRGHPDPVEWVEYVRSKDWTFQLPGIDYNEDGRMFFYGNIQEYSAAFRYLILDQKLTERIVAMAPEVPIRRYGLDGNELPESIFDGVVKGLAEEYAELGSLRVAFEYQGHQSHRIDAVTMARDLTKKNICDERGIVLIVVKPFRTSTTNPWDSDYVLAHVRQAVVQAFRSKGIACPNLNVAPLKVNLAFHDGVVRLDELRNVAEANGGKLLSAKWKGNTAKYRFAFADGREFETTAASIKQGWPKDPDYFFGASLNNPNRKNLHMENLRQIAEANGGKLLSTEWRGNQVKYRFSFSDGREFETLKGRLVSIGWPEDPDLYFRKGPAKPDAAPIFLDELRHIAKENDGRLLSTEWRGSKAKYTFAFVDGREFITTLGKLKRDGWPKDPEYWFKKSTNNPNRKNLHMENLRQIADVHGGQLLSTEWKGSAGKHRFAFADGQEFEMRADHLKQRGWPKNPNRYFKAPEARP